MKRRHAIVGRVADSLRLTYRTPAETVRAMLPEGLELVERGQWAFWDVVCEKVEYARPIGVPAFCGFGFTRVSYRLRAQAMTDRAEVVRGGYETRCDLNNRLAMRLILPTSGTRLGFARIAWDADDCGARCEARETHDAHGDLRVDAAHTPARLLPRSCFPTINDAQRFSAAMPCCMTLIERGGQRLLGTTQQRYETTARVDTPVSLRIAQIGYFESIGQDQHAALEWASRVGPSTCRWNTERTGALLQQSNVIAAPELIAG